MPDVSGQDPYLALWDWRRRTAALYAAVRTAPDPISGWSAWRHGRDELFRDHLQTPVEAGASFDDLSYFAYDPALRFTVGLQPKAGSAFTVDAGGDGVLRLRGFAETQGLAEAFGRELMLFWVEGYGGGAFLPFADATNGTETYGGGRYLLDTIKGADLGARPDGLTVLDFNFAYNPSCSYSPRYVCPLAPAENRVTVPVRAGERGSAA